MTVFLQDPDVTLHHGDALTVLKTLPSESVHCCVTSPPFFGLRDYQTGTWEGGNPDCDHTPPKREHGTYDNGQGQSYTSNNTNWDAPHKSYGKVCGKCGARRVDQQIGLEETPEQWVEALVAVFREVRRVLRPEGVLVAALAAKQAPDVSLLSDVWWFKFYLNQRPGAAERPHRRQRGRHQRLRRLALQRGRARRRLSTGCRSPARPRSSITTGCLRRGRAGGAPETWSEFVEVAPELVKKDGDTVTRSAFAHPTAPRYIAWLFQGGRSGSIRRLLLRPRFHHPHQRAERRRGRRVLPLVGRGRLGDARQDPTTVRSTSSTG